MIRNHLLNWHIKLKVNNYQEFIDAVLLLKEEDQETAAALWNARVSDKLAIIMAFHHLDSFKDHTGMAKMPCGYENCNKQAFWKDADECYWCDNHRHSLVARIA